MKYQTITEQLLFSTVRIETDTGVGTGFLLQAQLNFGGSVIFLITNKHVIKGAKIIKFFFTKGEEVITIEKDKRKIKIFSKKEEEEIREIIPKTGEKFECSLNGEEWFEHPDSDVDLTLMNLSPVLNEINKKGIKIFIKTIPLDLIPPKESLENLDALENILFIGYPNGIYDSKNLYPIIRRGITATPIYSDYEGKSLFLIDASVFPGSSGSPVFIYDKGGYKDKKGNMFMGQDRIIFCGVISSVFFQNEEGEIEFRDIPTKVTPFMKKSEKIDLGVVIKSEKVKELLDLYLKNINEKNRQKNEK
ncbi:MAG: serine protease [Candidatus Pacearchaeota archaeon]|jgi:hypothetical protein